MRVLSLPKRKHDRLKRLRTAKVLGTISLIWAVCTVNPFLIIAAVCSWVACSGQKKGFARAAEVCYIIGAVTSSLLALSIALLGNVIAILGGLASILGGTSALIGAALAFDALIAGAAVCSHKGIADLDIPEKPAVEMGFFGGELYVNENEDDE